MPRQKFILQFFPKSCSFTIKTLSFGKLVNSVKIEGLIKNSFFSFFLVVVFLFRYFLF